MGYNTSFTGKIRILSEDANASFAIVSGLLDRFDDAEKMAADFHFPEDKLDSDRAGYFALSVKDDNDGSFLTWDGSEKTYGMVNALNILMFAAKSISPSIIFHGEMVAQGEGVGDIWGVSVKDSFATRVEFEIGSDKREVCCPACGKRFVPE